MSILSRSDKNPMGRFAKPRGLFPSRRTRRRDVPRVVEQLEERTLLTNVAVGFLGNEPHLVVNPLDPSNVVVSDVNTLAISNDAGRTFPTFTNATVPAGFVRCGDDVMAFDSQGRLFWSYLECHLNGIGNVDAINVFDQQVNPLTGTLVGNAVNVSNLNPGLHNDDKQWIAVDSNPASPFRDNIYLHWTNFDTNPTQEFFSRSTDGGNTFSPPQAVTAGGGEGFRHQANIAVAPNGDVYLSYHTDVNGPANGGTVQVIRDTTGGANLAAGNFALDQKTVAFTTAQATVTSNRQPQPGALGYADFLMQGAAVAYVVPDPVRPGRIYVIGNDDPNNTYNNGDDGDVVMSTSTDFGATWTTYQTIDHAPAGTLQVFPQGAMDKFGNLATFWYDARAGSTNATGKVNLDVFASTSTNGGATFAPNDIKITDANNIFNPDVGAPNFGNPPDSPPTRRIGEYNGIAVVNGIAYVAWTGNTFNGPGGTADGQQIFFDTFVIPNAVLPPGIRLLDNGVLEIDGDNDFAGEDDTFRLVRDAMFPNMLDVFINNNTATPTYSVPINLIKQINVNGLGGNDRLIVDSSNGLISVPNGIRYDGGTGIANNLVLTQTGGPTQTSETEGVGASPGLGIDTIVGPGLNNTQVVEYQNLSPVFTNVPATTLTIAPATLPIFGISGSVLNSANAINYADGGVVAGLNTGVVTIDTAEPIQFTNKAGLIIDAGPGSDEINLNDPTVPTGLGSLEPIVPGITVNGGDPTASDTLIVNTVPFSTFSVPDSLIVVPTGTGAGVVEHLVRYPSTVFSGIEGLKIVGAPGAASTFAVDGTTGNDQMIYTPGATPDTGTFTGAMDQNNATGNGPFALVPITYSGMSPTASFGLESAGFVINDNAGFFGPDTGGTDTFVFNGTPGNDTFAISTPTLEGIEPAVAITNTTNGQVIGGVEAENFAHATVNGLGGLDTFNVSMVPAPLNTPVTINADATVNFVGDGLFPVTVNLATQTVQEGVYSPVSLVGVTTLNVSSGGAALTVLGTGIAGENLTYAPTGTATGTVTASDSPVTVTINTAGIGVPGTFTLNPNTPLANGASVTVDGTAGNDAIVAASAANPTVQVGTFLPVILVPANTATLFVNGLGGNDNLAVDSTAGAFPIPITYDGGGGSDSLTLSQKTPPGAVALTDTYAPGPNPGSGVDTINFGTALAPVLQVVKFVNLAPVLDLVPAATLIVTGTNGNDAINYTTGSIVTNGLVSVNNLETIEFSNKDHLVISALAGDDTINLNNPNVPNGSVPIAKLQDITVNGGDPTASDTLIVNGTTAAETLVYTPSGTTIGSGTVAVTALPTVIFTTIEHLTIDGRGGNDTLQVVTPAGADQLTLTPGAGVDSGALALTNNTGGAAVSTYTPLAFQNLGATGQLLLSDTGAAPADTLIYNGTAGNDTFAVTNVAGETRVSLFNSQNPAVKQILVRAPGVANLVLNGLAGDDTFNVTGPLPATLTSLTLAGGDPSASDVANLIGDGTPISVTVGGAITTVTGGGLGTVNLTSDELVNINNGAGSVTVTGTAGQPDVLAVTPTGPNTVQVQDNGKAPLVTVTTTGAFTVAGNVGDNDTVAVNGTGGNDAIVATSGAAPTVVVNALKTVTLGANIATLDVNGLDGNDTLNVNSTAGAFPIPIVYDGGTGQDQLVLTQGAGPATVTTDTYSAGPNPGEGVSTLQFSAPVIATQTVSFKNVEPVIDLVPANLLIVNGTPAANAINYTVGPNSGTTLVGLFSTGQVTIDNFESIEFSNKTQLTINGQAGSDEINLNNPTVPTGLTAITVVGGDPTASDTLIVNGTTGADAIKYTTSAIPGTGSVAVNALPLVSFTGIEHLAINGQGGGDGLTVVTQLGADTAVITPGAAGDAGHIDISDSGAGGVPTGVPLDFSNLGNGQLIVSNGVGRADTVVYNGTPGNDMFNLTNIGWLVLNNRVPVIPAGATNVVLNGLAGDDLFNITGANLIAVPVIASLQVNGGAGGANDVLNYTAVGGITDSVAVNLPDNTIAPPTPGSVAETPPSGTIPLVTFTGLAVVDVHTSGGGTLQTFTVNGTTGPDNIAYTPTGAASGIVSSAGLTVNFANVAGAFTIDPRGVAGGGNGDTVTVNGSPSADVITASGGPLAPVVTFASGAKGLNLVPLNTALLAVNAGLGNDSLIVDSSAGAFTIPILYDGGSGLDSLTLQGGTALTDTYTAGPNPGQGNVTLTFAGPVTEVVNFVNLAPVIDTVPSATLLVNGTGDNDQIGYTAGPTLAGGVASGLVTINNFETVTFANKAALTLAGGSGDDTITVNNPTTPAGLTALTVDGGLGNNTLVVNANNQPTLTANVTNTTVNVPGATPVPVGYTTIQQVKVINAKDALTGTAVPISAPEGVPVQDVLVATFKFTDAQPPTISGNASDFLATIDWGDKTIPTAGTIVQTAPDATGTITFQVFGSHTFAAAGPLTATVTIFDKGSVRNFTPAGGVPASIQDNIGATTVVTPIAVTVSGALLTAQGTTFAPKEGTAGTFVVATFVDTNPNATAADFTTPGSVVINWGDGTSDNNNTTPLIVVVTKTGASGTGVTFSVTGTHTYIEEGTFQVLVTITDKNLDSTIALSTANVSDSAPTAGIPQPTIAPTENKPFNGPVASFFEIWTDPVHGLTNAEPVSDFVSPAPLIHWGDGSPDTVGTVVADPLFPAGSGHYLVLGSHTYTNAGGFPTGTFSVTTTIHDDGGTALVITNPAVVTEVPVTLAGQLNPASDSGKSQTDGTTNNNQPSFFGTTEPFAFVKLYANGQLVGQTEALSDGSWNLTTNRLADGAYTISTTATDADNPANTITTRVLPNATQGPLVIDTVGPRITFASFNRFNSTATFAFEDIGPGASGLLVQSLGDAANYAVQQIVKVRGKISVKPLVVTSINVTPGSTPNSDNVTVVFNNGNYLVGGYFQLIARAESVLLRGGIQDVAGNALDGEYYGPTSSTGNGVPGGDFVANFTIVHNRNSGPQTIIGFPHPNDPPATFPTNTNKHAPARNHFVTKAALTIHKPALASLAFTHRKKK